MFEYLLLADVHDRGLQAALLHYMYICGYYPVKQDRTAFKRLRLFLETELNQTENMELLSWEALMKDRYLLSEKQEKSRSTETRIMDTAQK